MHALVNIFMVTVDGCANGFPNMNLVTTKASRVPTNARVMTSGLSLLNTFTCRGTLTGLVLGVDVRTETSTRSLYPEVSLWRPREEGNLDEGFVKVPESGRTVRLTAANFSTSGAFDYPLDPPLNFRASDILAWEQPELAKSVVRMYASDGLVSSSSDDDNSRGSNPVLLLYPVTGELQLYTHLVDLFVMQHYFLVC